MPSDCLRFVIGVTLLCCGAGARGGGAPLALLLRRCVGLQEKSCGKTTHNLVVNVDWERKHARNLHSWVLELVPPDVVDCQQRAHARTHARTYARAHARRYALEEAAAKFMIYGNPEKMANTSREVVAHKKAAVPA